MLPTTLTALAIVGLCLWGGQLGAPISITFAHAHCYDNSTPYQLPMPIGADGLPECGLGYHCPHFNVSDPSSYPEYCTPTPECVVNRAFGDRCDPMGDQEPDVCMEGYYCPTATDMIECPQGYYCTFASYEPTKCPPLSSCPAGSHKVLYFGGIVASLCLIGAFFVLLFTYRFWGVFSTLKEDFGDAERFLSVVSARSPVTASPRLNDDDVLLRPAGSADLTLNATSTFLEVQNHRKHAISVLAGGFLRARSTKPLTYEIKDMKVFAPQNQSSSRKGQNFGAVAKQREKEERLNLEQTLKKDPSLAAATTTNGGGGCVSSIFQKKRIPILKGVTLTLRPATVTAILGPGGCGKSTLLNALLGRLPAGWEREGFVAVNGDASHDVLQRLRPVTGSASQTESLHRELTVYQNLFYNSQVRLPAEWSAEDRDYFLAATITALQLTKQKDIPIGDEESRGISGGQRRRAHIGIEIASAPYSLFLDEPTNGLDATTALEVCSCLSTIATGADLTVVMTISQPRLEIWNQLDDVIIMAKGGSTAYQGKRADAQDFFENYYGIPFRKSGNPADIIVDAVAERGAELCSKWAAYQADPSLYVRRENSFDMASKPTDDQKQQQTSITLNAPDNHLIFPVPAATDEDEENAPGYIPNSSEEGTKNGPMTVASSKPSQQQHHQMDQDVVIIAADADEVTNSNPPKGRKGNPRIVVTRSGAPFWRQVYLVARRSVAKQLSDLQPLVVEQCVNVVVAAVMGMSSTSYNPYWSFKNYKLLSPPDNDLLPQIFMYCCMSLGIVCVMPASSIFSNARDTYYREAASGFNKLAYYLGSVIAIQPRIILTAMVFTTLFQLIPAFAVDFGGIFLFVWLLASCSYAVGILPTMLFEAASAPLVGSLFAILFGCMSGFIKFPLGIKYLSYGFWASSALQHYFQKPVKHAYEDLGVSAKWTNDPGLAVGITILILFIIHTASFCFMVGWNRHKQR